MNESPHSRLIPSLASIIQVNPTKNSSYDYLKSHILSSHFCECFQSNSCSLPDIIHSLIYRALEHPLLHAYRDVILREQHTRKAITLNACIQNVEHAFFTGKFKCVNVIHFSRESFSFFSF